jgi:hypothetical protein
MPADYVWKMTLIDSKVDLARILGVRKQSYIGIENLASAPVTGMRKIKGSFTP